MSLAYTIMSGNNFQSCTVNLLNHIIRVIHLAVPICHDRKVNTRHCKTEGCWFILQEYPLGSHRYGLLLLSPLYSSASYLSDLEDPLS